MTVFLEFYGLPGCGKSTISHLVAEELRKQGKIVNEPTYDLDHKYSAGKRKTIKLLKLIQYAITHPRSYSRLRQLIKANEYSGSELVSQAANIAPKLWTYENAESDYVIFDEGLTQSAISLCQGKQNSVENETELYGLCKNRSVYKFYIRINAETALMRMAGRDKHDSRIEKIADVASRREAIRAFEKQCDRIALAIVVDNDLKVEAVNSILACFHINGGG